MRRGVTHKGDKVLWGGRDYVKISLKNRFPSMVFELLTGRRPKTTEAKIFELILNLSIDHGPETPSAAALIKAAKTGKTMGESLAAGVGEINDVHGGAGEKAMILFYDVKDREQSAGEAVRNILTAGKKVPGLGHRLYREVDPRAEAILEALRVIPAGRIYRTIAQDVSEALEKQTGKRLPLNVDGAIAAALCTFGLEPLLGKAVFMIARVPGLLAHFLSNRSSLRKSD